VNTVEIITAYPVKAAIADSIFFILKILKLKNIFLAPGVKYTRRGIIVGMKYCLNV